MDATARQIMRSFFAERVNAAAFCRFPEMNGGVPREVKEHMVELLLWFLDTPQFLNPVSRLTINTVEEFIEGARSNTYNAIDYEWRLRKYLGDLIVFILGFISPTVPAIPFFRGNSRDHLLDVAHENYEILGTFPYEGHERDRKFFRIISPYTEVCVIGLQSLKENMPYPKLSRPS